MKKERSRVESPFAVVASSCEYSVVKKTDSHRHEPDMENEQRDSEAAAETLKNRRPCTTVTISNSGLSSPTEGYVASYRQ